MAARCLLRPRFGSDETPSGDGRSGSLESSRSLGSTGVDVHGWAPAFGTAATAGREWAGSCALGSETSLGRPGRGALADPLIQRYDGDVTKFDDVDKTLSGSVRTGLVIP